MLNLLVIRYWPLLLQICIKISVILSELWDSKVKSDDLGTALSTRDLDEIVHEEP